MTTTESIKSGLRFAAIFTACILVGEVAGGIWTRSLALLSDAGHVFMDLFSLLLSLLAIHLAGLPVDDRRTFGWHRAEVLAALINGATLTGIAILIIHESLRRAFSPVEIRGFQMMLIALAGLLANLVVLLKLRGHHTQDLNLHSAFLHVLSDFIASIGVVVAGLIIYLTGWRLADSIISAAIGIAILAGALRVLKASGHILLEGVPVGLNLQEMADALKQVDGVRDIHHLHVWSICSNILAVSSHILIEEKDRPRSDDIIARIDLMLREQFGASCTTLQLDVVPLPGDALLQDIPHPPDLH